MYLLLVSRSPLFLFGVFCGVAVQRLSFCGVLLMSSFSLSPLSSISWSRSSVVVSRLGWDSSSRSILLWVLGSAVPLVCRTGGADPESISDLTGLLRKSRDTGLRIVLGVRKGWSPDRWFCAATDIPAIADVTRKPKLALVDTFDGEKWGQHTIDENGCVVEG